MSATKLPSTKPDTAWDEAQLSKSIEDLNELHLKLRRLRTVIRRMIEPIAKQQASPEALFASFVAGVKMTQEEMTVFRQLWTDEWTREVLEHAKQSREDNPKGIVPWRSTFIPREDLEEVGGT
jgi:hypothetical protein